MNQEKNIGMINGTHKRSFEHVLGRENLIRGIKIPILHPTPVDRHEVVHARHHHHKKGACDGLDDDGAAAAFQPVQAHDDKLPQGGLEHEDHDQGHLGEY